MGERDKKNVFSDIYAEVDILIYLVIYRRKILFYSMCNSRKS